LPHARGGQPRRWPSAAASPTMVGGRRKKKGPE
jgi:hypothetical protein